MPTAIVESAPVPRVSTMSPPSRRTASVPFRRGVAASAHSPDSVTVDVNGNAVPARVAIVASGTAAKLAGGRNAVRRPS